jgi:hypothetical protein
VARSLAACLGARCSSSGGWSTGTLWESCRTTQGWRGLTEEVARRWGGIVELSRRRSAAMELAQWLPMVGVCPAAWRRRAMSRGTVGCDRPKLWVTLTDEGGRRHSSGGNRRCPVRSNASRSSWVDRASRGRKWGRRRGAPVLARGKRANEGRRRAMPFYGGSTA